uniref:Uncharacterized protein LOC105032784 n=1 Tax=Elaeis guineensis var. tenera TaxID=51953 RepID=A0A6I9Q9T3_ELAGV|nr:uncharacterized protein LOC105032784 [Elaeis guineensis]
MEYKKYRDIDRLLKLLTMLSPKFESVCASILHRDSLPSLSSALNELLSEEICKGLLTTKQHHQEAILFAKNKGITPLSKGTSSFPHRSDGKIDWSKVQCHFCHEFGHTAIKCPKKNRRLTPSRPTTAVGTTTDLVNNESGHKGSTPIFTATEVEDILVKALARQGNITSSSASALSATSGYANIPSHLSIRNVYYVPNLSVNLLFVDQLVENGLECIFSNYWEQQLKKVIGIGRKVNRLFEIVWLYTP